MLHRHEDTNAEHASAWDVTIWRSWMTAITEGVLEWPWKAAVERTDMADAFDAIDVAVAASLEILPDGTLSPRHARAAVRRDATGRCPNPDALGDVLDRVSEDLPNHDLIVSGLGLADSDDHWRSELLEGWLDRILEARNDGLAIRGVFLDPTIDGYCEAAGDFVDAGVFSRNREPKPSFQWIAAQQ